jgi:hypothetical protein
VVRALFHEPQFGLAGLPPQYGRILRIT